MPENEHTLSPAPEAPEEWEPAAQHLALWGELVLTPSTPQIDGDGTTHDVDEVIDNEAKIVG